MDEVMQTHGYKNTVGGGNKRTAPSTKKVQCQKYSRVRTMVALACNYSASL